MLGTVERKCIHRHYLLPTKLPVDVRCFSNCYLNAKHINAFMVFFGNAKHINAFMVFFGREDGILRVRICLEKHVQKSRVYVDIPCPTLYIMSDFKASVTIFY